MRFSTEEQGSHHGNGVDCPACSRQPHQRPQTAAKTVPARRVDAIKGARTWVGRVLARSKTPFKTAMLLQ
jgi:hypothetical protein